MSSFASFCGLSQKLCLRLSPYSCSQGSEQLPPSGVCDYEDRAGPGCGGVFLPSLFFSQGTLKKITIRCDIWNASVISMNGLVCGHEREGLNWDPQPYGRLFTLKEKKS